MVVPTSSVVMVSGDDNDPAAIHGEAVLVPREANNANYQREVGGANRVKKGGNAE